MMDSFISAVCSQLGATPNPRRVILDAFLCIQNDKDLLAAYNALQGSVWSKNQQIAKRIKDYYGFSTKSHGHIAEGCKLIKTYSELQHHN